MNLYKKIVSGLKKNKNDKVADGEKRFNKNKVISYGLKTSVLHKVFKQFKKDIDSLSLKGSFDLVTKFYSSGVQEQIFFGTYILKLKKEDFKKSDLYIINNVSNYFTSWAVVDNFCIDVLQPVLLKFPKEILSLMKDWNKSKNMWRRRASVVVFVRTIGESGKFTAEGLKLCSNLIWDKEDLVQKGVGWALKDMMRIDKKKVFNYVKKIRKDGVSSVITLYAIRDLKGKERKEILKIKS
ncbi:MAG: DNA alkylation repair protein [Candidatus Pacebacteria bacterium]|nr:DNA alkylation repair protein [Candidatus Paceibacterota bacterium]